ncbi:MAG: hypothetical protein ACFFCW_29805 [Candidatus Hodarchaeota archaeon]
MRNKVLLGLVYLEGHDFPTYYSRGAKKRAERLSLIAETSVDFIREFFEADVQNILLVLNEEDMAKRIDHPYGLIHGIDNYLWYPVYEEDNPVYQALMPYYENSPEHLRRKLDEVLPDSDSPFLKACLIWWETYMVHELFHNYSKEDGVRIGLSWFDELFGDYINYAFLRRYENKYPTERKVSEVYFDLLYQGGRSLVRYTSLEDFEELYLGVGTANYCWYHGWFNVGVFELYERFGESFIEKVNALYKSETGFDSTGDSLAARLDEPCNGFLDWYIEWKQHKLLKYRVLDET